MCYLSVSAEVNLDEVVQEIFKEMEFSARGMTKKSGEFCRRCGKELYIRWCGDWIYMVLCRNCRMIAIVRNEDEDRFAARKAFGSEENVF